MIYIVNAKHPRIDDGGKVLAFTSKERAEAKAKELVLMIGDDLAEDFDAEGETGWNLAKANDWQPALHALWEIIDIHGMAAIGDCVWIEEAEIDLESSLSIDIRAMRLVDGEWERVIGKPEVFSIYICNPAALHLGGIPITSDLPRPASDVDKSMPEAEVCLSDEVDAAMCLWEAYLELNRKAYQSAPAKEMASENPFYDAVMKWHEDNGYGEVRCQIAAMAADCHRDWEAALAAGEVVDSFDWDFCPAWLQARLRRDLGLPAAEIVALLNKRAQDGDDKYQFWQDCARDLYTKAKAGEVPFTPEQVAEAIMAEIGILVED